MKRKIISGTCFLLTTTAVVLLVLKQYEVAVYAALIAWLSSVAAVKKATLLTDPYMSLISAATLGICFTPTFEIFPYYFLACTFLSMTGFFRTVFGSITSLFGMMWLEPFFMIAGTAFYVAANILIPSGWQGWVLPAPLILFYSFLAMGHFIDYKNMKKAIGNNAQFNVLVGQAAPDFSLPDQDGNMTTLSDYKKEKKSVLLIFVRGDWCPSCHIMLRTYQRNKEKFSSKNITVMAIGPDPVGINREMVESLNVEYKILSDEALDCSRKYGIKKAANNVMTTYADGVPLPASFLVCYEGILRYTSRADKPGEILNPGEMFSVLEKLN